MSETTRTTYIRTDSESIEETLLVNDGRTSTLKSRIYRKRTESFQAGGEGRGHFSRI